jgi:hypothetical protein
MALRPKTSSLRTTKHWCIPKSPPALCRLRQQLPALHPRYCSRSGRRHSGQDQSWLSWLRPCQAPAPTWQASPGAFIVSRARQGVSPDTHTTDPPTRRQPANGPPTPRQRPNHAAWIRRGRPARTPRRFKHGNNIFQNSPCNAVHRRHHRLRSLRPKRTAPVQHHRRKQTNHRRAEPLWRRGFSPGREWSGLFLLSFRRNAVRCGLGTALNV